MSTISNVTDLIIQNSFISVVQSWLRTRPGPVPVHLQFYSSVLVTSYRNRRSTLKYGVVAHKPHLYFFPCLFRTNGNPNGHQIRARRTFSRSKKQNDCNPFRQMCSLLSSHRSIQLGILSIQQITAILSFGKVLQISRHHHYYSCAT